MASFIKYDVIYRTIKDLAVRYEINLYKMTSLESVIFITRFVIFYVIREMDNILPILSCVEKDKFEGTFYFTVRHENANDFAISEPTSADTTPMRMRMENQEFVAGVSGPGSFDQMMTMTRPETGSRCTLMTTTNPRASSRKKGSR